MDQQFKKQTEELLKIGRAADKVDKELADFMEALIKHPAWLAYQKQLDTRIQAHSDVVLGPAGSVDGAMTLEHIKGTMRGLLIARELPSVIIAAMKTASPVLDGEE